MAEGHGRARLRDFRFAGADNEAVLKGWLGLNKRQITALEREGAIFNARPLATRDQLPPAPGGTSPDFAERLGPPSAPGK